MMQKRIESEYKNFASSSMLSMASFVFKMSNITNDKGDIRRDGFEPYNYEEESAEIQPPKHDNLGKSPPVYKPNDLKARVRVKISSKNPPKLRLKKTGVRFRGDDRSVRSPDRTSRARRLS